MLKNTLTHAIIRYRIYMHMDNNFSDHEIDIISRQLDACENYLSQDNKVTATWMVKNQNILSKVVEYAHAIVHAEDTKDGINTDLHGEHQDLDKCMTFFKELK